MRVSRAVVDGFADVTRGVLTVFPGSISSEKRRLADRGGRRHFLSAAASRLTASRVLRSDLCLRLRAQLDE
ncbi:MAG TPA: hypothetical protein VJR89_12090, partial [Polyangiales bacterium]|nr:hypothetical protein [Polyangiales bacterium]